MATWNVVSRSFVGRVQKAQGGGGGGEGGMF